MKSLTKFTRPNVVVSKCLCGERCRWDGDRLAYPFIRALRRYARIIPVCPEVEIGLGVPRDRIILVSEKSRLALYQSGPRRHLARKMNSFARQFLKSHPDTDGFILKHKSPSCGIRKVKLYASIAPDAGFVRRGTGFFAAQVLEQFSHTPIEDEERLADHRLREHWLTGLFTLAAFRTVRKSHSLNRLAAFHSYHRSLLSAHHRRLTRELDNLAREPDAATTGDCETIEQYENVLRHILASPPRRDSVVKSYELARDHYSQYLSANEKRCFKRRLDQYRAGQTPLSDVRKTVQIWAVRYDKTFTRRHALFRPYPSVLADG